jgi:uncharacterized lipoprotein YddW (UPF0748 family)
MLQHHKQLREKWPMPPKQQTMFFGLVFGCGVWFLSQSGGWAAPTGTGATSNPVLPLPTLPPSSVMASPLTPRRITTPTPAMLPKLGTTPTPVTVPVPSSSLPLAPVKSAPVMVSASMDRYKIAAVNPTATTNPGGSGFPGYRGGQQLVVYTPQYGAPQTGTNEFGFEVTVVNGRVTEQEGANSAIPLTGDPNTTFVISGHGKARDWLITQAPIGARVVKQGDMLTVSVSPETYVYQLEQRLQVVQPRVPHTVYAASQRQLQRLKAQYQQNPSDNSITAQAQTQLAQLNQAAWEAMPRFAPKAIRGVWHRPTETTEATIAAKLDRLKLAGFNAIFLETFYHGYTIFPSATYRAYQLPTPYPRFAATGFDMLEVWTRLAHKRRMQVHVWFQTFYGGTRAFESPGPILSRYPQWANVQRVALQAQGPVPSNVETGHYFLDPANPQATEFLHKLLTEIATNYPVDGIQLDYIRYGSSFPVHRFSYVNTTWGYTPVARQVFMAKNGVDPATLMPEQTALWQAWNDQKVAWVNQFVQQAHSRIKKANPSVQISAAVFPGLEDAMLRKHQDWATWAKNGWVDFLAPMTLTSAAKVVAADTKRLIELTDKRIPVVAGVFGAFNGNTPALLLDQVYSAHQGGAAGVCVFDSAHLTPDQQHALMLGVSAKPVPWVR